MRDYYTLPLTLQKRFCISRWMLALNILVYFMDIVCYNRIIQLTISK